MAEVRELVDTCVHCGFCLPACPTYVLWGREADSPRGRIYLTKARIEGRAESPDTFQRHIDACLGCMACVTACPSGVRYDQLIERVRPTVEAQRTRSLTDRIYRQLLFSILPYPVRLKVLAAILRTVQTLGIQGLIRSTGLTRLLPARLAALDRLAPTVASNGRELPTVVSAVSRPRKRVGLLLGCVQRVFFGGVNAATARVLAAEGCEVRIPATQGCCGALMLHAGRIDEARRFARALIDVFEGADVDQIVINAAGCGSAMKEYGELFADDPAYAEKARAFASKCVDVSEALTELAPRAVRHPLPWRVAYHDACHLQHAQRIKQQPRQLLQSIPKLEVVEIAEPELCCGSAGVYNLLEPDAARDLGDRKAAHIADTGADVLVSSNPGCLIQIASSLESAGRKIRTMHLVEVLDASLREQT